MTQFPESRRVRAFVDRLTAEYISLWADSPETWPEPGEPTSPEAQTAKEEEIEKIIRSAEHAWRRDSGHGSAERFRLRGRIRMAVAQSFAPGDDGSVGRFFEECEHVADCFVRRARTFDPEVTEDDIHQALRNQWVFNSIQQYLATPISLTASSFAYSMLYPYTDNWLDAEDSPQAEKERLLCWLAARLAGDPGGVAEGRTGAVDTLIRMIEDEYPRLRYPAVYESLKAIHASQQESVRLLTPAPRGAEADLLAITIRKGGTSVLADGFLAAGNLADQHATAMFGYGVLLQLIDDLQDIENDAAAGQSTPMIRAVATGTLEAATNRLIWFIRRITLDMERSASKGNSWIAGLIDRSCVAMALEAIARQRRLYSERYLAMVGARTPVRLECLGSMRKRVRRMNVGAR
ncbi:MAG: hypothetical protein AB1428_09515 [Bacteroidota bacterium]